MRRARARELQRDSRHRRRCFIAAIASTTGARCSDTWNIWSKAPKQSPRQPQSKSRPVVSWVLKFAEEQPQPHSIPTFFCGTFGATTPRIRRSNCSEPHCTGAWALTCHVWTRPCLTMLGSERAARWRMEDALRRPGARRGGRARRKRLAADRQRAKAPNDAVWFRQTIKCRNAATATT
jgi:hypothetical protein